MARISPYATASTFSKIFYAWFIPVLKYTSGRALTSDDLRLGPQESVELIADAYERDWKLELKKKNPSLAKVIIKNLGPSFVGLIVMCAIGECVVRNVQSLLIGYTIRLFSSPETCVFSSMAVCGALFGILLTSLLCALEQHHWVANSFSDGVQARMVITVMLYRKMCRMSSRSLARTSSGELLSGVSSELSILEFFCDRAGYLVVAPLQLLIVTYALWTYVGWSCLTGLASLFAITIVQSYLKMKVLQCTLKTQVYTDRRVRLMTQVISAIKLVKFNCWEDLFADGVKEQRRDEISVVRQSWTLRALIMSIFYVSSHIATFITLTAFVAYGGRLTLENALVTTMLLNNLRLSVTSKFPEAIVFGAELLQLTLRRVETILLMDDQLERLDTDAVDGSVIMDKICAKWNESTSPHILDNITMSVEPGQLVMVTGKVGSGKSSLLAAISGELEPESGSIGVGGALSLAPQESWCFGATVRENVVLTNVFDEERFRRVVHVCGLEHDLDQFPDGDLTIIGEMGYKLSGGQKARVTLARAIYHKADVYLLDDPLSAVDPSVAKHIFEKCVLEFLKNKTVVLVTHQVQFLESADRIVVFDEGRVVASGSFSELASNSKEFDVLSPTRLDCGNEEERGSSYAISSTLDAKRNRCSSPEGLSKKLSPRKKESSLKCSSPSSLQILFEFLAYSDSNLLVLAAILISIGSEALMHYTNIWLSQWTQDFSDGDRTNQITFYFLLTSATLLTTFLRLYTIVIICTRTCVNVHSRQLDRVLGAQMRFFENTPLGDILGRFVHFLTELDHCFPHTLCEMNMAIVKPLGLVVMVASIEPMTVIVAAIAFLVCIPVRSCCSKSLQSLANLVIEIRSPVHNHLLNTYHGMQTIRCMGINGAYDRQFVKLVNHSLSSHYLHLTANGAIAFFLECFSLFYFSVISGLLVLFRSNFRGSDAGLILTYAIQLMWQFQFTVRLYSEYEQTLITSVAKALDMKSIEAEDEDNSAEAVNAGSSELDRWPLTGAVEYNHVSLKYDETQKNVIQNISFNVKSGQKIGIVGRTGAGKTSLVNCLFRLEKYEGEILIDGMNINSVGLKKLRSSISVIPQDPVLFDGTLRKNLDPYNEHSSKAIWEALESVRLEQFVLAFEGELNGRIAQGGSNLSIGQRQLLCLARAILRGNRIVVLDEATAAVDNATDQQIQATIRTRFAHCTVFTVAHRIETVLDMDRILVMDGGCVVESGHPQDLLKNRESFFSQMCLKAECQEF